MTVSSGTADTNTASRLQNNKNFFNTYHRRILYALFCICARKIPIRLKNAALRQDKKTRRAISALLVFRRQTLTGFLNKLTNFTEGFLT